MDTERELELENFNIQLRIIALETDRQIVHYMYFPLMHR